MCLISCSYEIIWVLELFPKCNSADSLVCSRSTRFCRFHQFSYFNSLHRSPPSLFTWNTCLLFWVHNSVPLIYGSSENIWRFKPRSLRHDYDVGNAHLQLQGSETKFPNSRAKDVPNFLPASFPTFLLSNLSSNLGMVNSERGLSNSKHSLNPQQLPRVYFSSFPDVAALKLPSFL